MGMETAYLKEHEGIVHNSVGQLSSASAAAGSSWWSISAFGSHQNQSSVYGETSNYNNNNNNQIMKPFSLELHNNNNYIDQLASSANKQQQFLDKGPTTQFTIFPDCKISGESQKSQATLSLQPSNADPRNRFELGFTQPMICAKYPYMDQFYGLFSAYAPQISGRIMLPLNLTSDDGPTYVNAKQYHGIIRRRQSRAKSVLANKLIKRRKPYMHESRHLHAMRRPRGCGGRFLNTRNSATNNGNGKSGSEANKKGLGHQLHSSGSQSSEVLQSSAGTLNSLKETNGSSPNISLEVTSMYSSRGIDGFAINHIGTPMHSLADMMDTGHGHGMIMPPKWVSAAAGNCCNLNV
ncbi:nuclear transcription factor Y subunit A-10-like isoform X2 [Arachis stenosperma]|uniref:nuclear transcription factor Y subunit A-10-like isoform X2 n=1 Tax=Arachis stenosperma TaxID=217475 RepID=UPI0025ABFD4D|nr:nuclear transcription factor Y subunit A-10-like isoform X2 [Arachis stenosperma]